MPRQGVRPIQGASQEQTAISVVMSQDFDGVTRWLQSLMRNQAVDFRTLAA